MTSFNTGLSLEMQDYLYPNGDIGGIAVFTNDSTYDTWVLIEAQLTGAFIAGGHFLRGYKNKLGTITTVDKDWFSAPADQIRFFYPYFGVTDLISMANMRERIFYPGESLGFRGFAGTGSRFTVLKIKKAR